MGIFITIEGPNGVGKSTFIKELKERLSQGYMVFETKEPTDSDFGNYVRKNEGGLQGEAYAYLIAADRCVHVKTTIEPRLYQGELVISDRYIESSFVLQGYDGVSNEDIWRLNKKFLIPNLSVILLCSEEILTNRLNERTELTHYEKKMTRKEEIERYIQTAEYLKGKGYNNVILQNNNEFDFEKNVNNIIQLIYEMRENE